MKIKIISCLILVSLLLFTRQAGATFGRSVTVHFPGIFYGQGILLYGDGSSPTASDFSGFEVGFLFSLYQSVGDLLIQNNAKIEMGLSTIGDYDYSLTIHGKKVSEKIEHNDGSDPNFIRHFFQHIHDDVLRRIGKNRQRVKLEKVQFPVDGFTLQLGSFETKKEAVKFAKDINRRLSMAVAKFASNKEAKEAAYVEKHGSFEGYDYHEMLFCVSCLFQGNGTDDGPPERSIEVPSIFLKPYAGNDWRVNFGLFIREEDANTATKTVGKFYNGQSAVQKIKIDKEIIDKQT